jgi:hypothetical protein
VIVRFVVFWRQQAERERGGGRERGREGERERERERERDVKSGKENVHTSPKLNLVSTSIVEVT